MENNTTTTNLSENKKSKRISKFWEACLRSQGTIIINDPTLLP